MVISRDAFICLSSETDQDGRCSSLLQPGELAPGQYTIIFNIEDYFTKSGRESFYPSVQVSQRARPLHAQHLCDQISFNLKNPQEHYHIPLLISPYSYTTYRGS
ncbi:Transthyretin [Sistotremastrum niveocremeum HHB9708]|uniref:Transthyretin n=1 Tax=Sistotremastrum niveocremeum HHB9708 TaxID=1314777 RepID=A0A164UEN1_9AGAM|nr:Transthyretin [Sistotremastrum niveocremeum HHB9708]